MQGWPLSGNRIFTPDSPNLLLCSLPTRMAKPAVSTDLWVSDDALKTQFVRMGSGGQVVESANMLRLTKEDPARQTAYKKRTICLAFAY